MALEIVEGEIREHFLWIPKGVERISVHKQDAEVVEKQG